MKTKRKLVPKCRVIRGVGQTGILGIGASSSDSSQWGNSTDVGNMRQSGGGHKENVMDCSVCDGGNSSIVEGLGHMVETHDALDSLVDGVGDFVVLSSFGQLRKRIWDSTFITGTVEPIVGHPYIPLLLTTSNYATSSTKKLRADSHQHNGNSLNLSERSMHTNDRPTRSGGARIPVNDSTTYIHCSGPLSSKRPRAGSYEDGGNSFGSIEHGMRTNDSSSAPVNAGMSIKNFAAHRSHVGHYKHDGNSLGRDERLMRTDHCRSASVDAKIPVNNSPSHTHCSCSLLSDNPCVDGHGGNSSAVGQQSMRTNDDPNISVGASTTTKDYSAAINRSGHQRQSAFDRLTETYSPSITKSRPGRTSFRDRSRGRSRPHRLDASNGDRPENKECFCGVEESYDNSHSSYGTRINHEYRYHDRDRSRHMKRGRDSESPLSSVSKSDSSDGRHWKSKSKRHKPTDEDDLTMPWMYEEVDPFTPRIRNFISSRKTRMPNNVKTYDGTGDPKNHVKKFQAATQVERWAIPTWFHMFNSTPIGAARVWFDELSPESIDRYKDLKAAFLAYFMQQKKYVKDPVEIHNIKQKDGETIEDFMERFKVETGRMKGALECMRVSRFMHGVNNPELTKRLNEHVPKTMEKMMITTDAFIRGEAIAASKKKDHTQKVTQSFKRVREITFPSLATGSGTEGPLVIEAKIGGHLIHRMYVDGGSSTEVLYEHCFNRLRPEVNNQMVPATTSSTGFSGETIWPLGQLRLLVTIGDVDHSTRAWMNFMIVRSLSPYNGIIGRP
nr:reverse transcriptase domain-containing protein [Tanacetum cinerariifolium]